MSGELCAVRRAPYLVLMFTLGVLGCVSPDAHQWHEEDGYRWRALRVPRRGHPGFSLLPPTATGITFENNVDELDAPDSDFFGHGSGVAIGDIDGDGWVDLYLASGAGRNVLYRNLGHWRFEDITDRAGVALPELTSTGAVFADVDGDEDPDLLVTALRGPNVLLINDGSGIFARRNDAGLESDRASETSTLADVDGDGDLDLYIANYRRRSVRELFTPEEMVFDSVVRRVGDQMEIAPKFRAYFRLEQQPGLDRVGISERAEPDLFYLNNGRGRFEEVPFTTGRFLDEDGRSLAEAPDFFALTARFFDVDNDGDPDLYVCNDFSDPDFLWLNQGDGTFRASPHLALRATSHASMAVDFSDVDRDGSLDFFVADMLSRDLRRRKTQVPSYALLPKPVGVFNDRPQTQRNRLFLGRGDTTWAQLAEYAGIDASEWTWGTLFLDVDLDGYEDLFVTTGHIWDQFSADVVQRSRRSARIGASNVGLFSPLELANLVFRNVGGGRFEEVSTAWGVGGEADISHGLAAGDLDGDGDLDVVVNRLGAPAAIYRNEAAAPRVLVRLKGQAPNTHGIGAQVTLAGGPVRQMKELTAGGLYLSSSAPEVSFATGRGEALTLTVRWRSGRVSHVQAVRPNRLYEIVEPAAPVEPPGLTPRTPHPWFIDATSTLGHIHHEAAFLDYQRQPLLPNKFSQDGPGVSWLDLDRDGAPELVLPSGTGGRLAAFQYRQGRFEPYPLPNPLRAPAAGDQTMVLLVPPRTLLVAQQNYEVTSPPAGRALAQVFAVDLDTGRRTVVHTGEPSTVGPLALADVDGDGDLDLFVGGRVIPTAYPLTPRSFLYRRDGSAWVRDTLNQAVLDTVGLVSAAVFSDIDQDGHPDLLLATEWGPVRMLRNDGGRFVEVTDAVGLASMRSRWRGLATGDLDADGRLEILATSWGENTTRRPTRAHPWRLYYGDFDRSGSLDVLEAQFDASVGTEVPLLEDHRWLHEVLPYTRQLVPTAAAYATASVRDVIGPQFDPTAQREVTTLTHIRFVPQPNGTYLPVPLPAEAQWAPASAIVVADVTGDGHQDVFLSQNFFPTELTTPRYDAGRGLLLLGDGTGQLTPVPGQHSGLRIYGDQRGAALADYNADGRVDLVVAQNGAQTKLYRNQGARPGLRVRLVGVPANPDAIGAQLRLVYAERRGPVQEMQAGSGYWSHNGAVQVLGLGLQEQPTAVWVRWPGGRETEVPLEPGMRDITIRMPQ